MYSRFRTPLLRWLRVPPEPHTPIGDPKSLRIFRAGKNYLTLRLLGWAGPQLLALVGIVFWTTVLIQVDHEVRARRTALASPAARSPDTILGEAKPPPSPPAKTGDKTARKKVRVGGWAEFRQAIVELALHLPAWSFPLLWVLKIGGILLYLAQIPLTFAVRRLDYEMRWYVVTDRSLRIRTGVWQVQELTMSFANLQQVVVTQGPLQRFLGLADVRVQSAGGGGNGPKKGQDESLHTAVFHSVEHAPEIRDLILERLRRFRAAGLGDPDDHADPMPTPAAAVSVGPDDALAAVRELLAEARALRGALK